MTKIVISEASLCITYDTETGKVRFRFGEMYVNIPKIYIRDIINAIDTIRKYLDE